MALTVTRTGDWMHLAGNRRVANVVVAFDSSYPTGGESFVAADVGMRVIEKVQIQPDNGYNFEFDYTNNLLIVYKDQTNTILSIDNTAVDNGSTTSSDAALITYAFPASTLTASGMGARVTAWGRASNAHTQKTMKCWFGSNGPLGTATLLQATTWGWRTVYEVYRVAASSADSTVQFVASATIPTPLYGTVEAVLNTTIDHSVAQTIRVTANSTSTSSVTCEGMIVELIKTPGTGGAGVEVAPTTDLSSLDNVRVTVWGY